VVGSLETKYKWAEHGLTLTEKWNTDNTLGTEITVEDQVGVSVNVKVTGSGRHSFVCVFYSVNQIKYNIILYNIQKRKTEKVKVEAKNAYKFLS